MNCLPNTSKYFKGLHFNHEIIVLCVRWYVTYKLSYRDLVEMMEERGILLAHTTILRWIQHYIPQFENRWRKTHRTVGGSWYIDETYLKVKGKWTFLYRAVDRQGKTIDFLLSQKRNQATAMRFLRNAIVTWKRATKLTPRLVSCESPSDSAVERHTVLHTLGEDSDGQMFDQPH